VFDRQKKSAVPRQMPRWADIAPMLPARPSGGTRSDRRLARTSSVAELRAVARRRTPRAVFDYVDGGAEGEISMARARAAWERVEFAPKVLQDVGAVDLGASILGRGPGCPWSWPRPG
jgi:L-lactate dehydrogenase (cytochrome)